MAGGEIGIGDLLRGLRVGPGDFESRRRIAGMLGFQVQGVAAPAGNREPETSEQRSRRADRNLQPTARLPERPIDRPTERQLPTLRPSGRAQFLSPVSVDVKPMARDRRTRAGRAKAVLRPLIPPNAARGVITDIVSRMMAVGPIDTTRMVRVLAELRPVTTVPRLPRARLRHEVMLVADSTSPMSPFRRDAAFIYGLLVGLFDADRVDFRGVRGNPRVILTDRPSVEAGQFVLAITDLGAGSVELNTREKIGVNWLLFASLVSAKGADLVVLNPYPPDRWPVECRREMRILHLDRRTRRPPRDIVR